MMILIYDPNGDFRPWHARFYRYEIEVGLKFQNWAEGTVFYEPRHQRYWRVEEGCLVQVDLEDLVFEGILQ